MILAHVPLVSLLEVSAWSVANLVASVVGIIAVVKAWWPSPRRRCRLRSVALPLCFGTVSLFCLAPSYGEWPVICFAAVPAACGVGALVGWLTRNDPGADPGRGG